MKKYIILLTFLILGCSQYYHIKQSQSELLETAFKNQSLDLFDKFLNNWESNQKEHLLLRNSISNDTIKSLYEIYELLFEPLEWSKNRSDSNLAQSYKGIRNIIIPTEIEYKIEDSLLTRNQLVSLELNRTNNSEYIYYPKTLVENKITNFIPKYREPGIRALYLTSLYKNILDEFLEKTQYKYNKEKLKFLGNLTSIRHGHWGGYFLTSHPELTEFRFNKSMTRVIVPYRYMYGGGDIILEKINGRWTKIGFGGSWIE